MRNRHHAGCRVAVERAADRYTLICDGPFFYAEYWHSDVQKSAEYEAASAHQKEFIAKCAEIRTFHAIPFIRTMHDWITEVRKMGMDI